MFDSMTLGCVVLYALIAFIVAQVAYRRCDGVEGDAGAAFMVGSFWLLILPFYLLWKLSRKTLNLFIYDVKRGDRKW